MIVFPAHIVSRVLAFSFLFFLISCGNSETESGAETEAPDQFPAFDDFPDSLFYGVNFGQSNQETELELLTDGFELTDSSGSKYFLNKTDSTEFILPDRNKLTSFKVFLYSTRYITNKQALMNRFDISASESSLSNEFSVFQYELDSVDFKLSVFAQEDYLRLNFEERVSK